MRTLVCDGAWQDYGAAIKCYTAALEEDEEDCVALCNRSAAYYCMELFKTSLKDADAALAIDNTCAKAWERRALALEGMGRKQESHKTFTEGLMLGGEIDSYLNFLRQLGLKPPSKHMGAVAAPVPMLAPKSAPTTPQPAAAQRPASTKQPAAASASPSVRAKAQPAAGTRFTRCTRTNVQVLTQAAAEPVQAHKAHSSSEQDEANSMPASRAPAHSPATAGKQSKRAAQSAASAGSPSPFESREVLGLLALLVKNYYRSTTTDAEGTLDYAQVLNLLALLVQNFKF